MSWKIHGGFLFKERREAMSTKERHRRRICKAVFYESWRMYERTGKLKYGFSLCLKLAWKTICSKLRFIYSKVRGVLFDRRQHLLYRLMQYDCKDITLSFKRESQNKFDPSAVAITATVKEKGTAKIGYLSKALAANVAALLDTGKDAVVVFEGITGKSKPYLGCNFRFVLL